MNKTMKDKKYLFQYFLYGLTPLVGLFFSGQFKDIASLLSCYLFFVILMYYFPLSLFVFGASIKLAEDGIVLVILGIEKCILFEDINFYVNNDGTWGGVFSLSDNRITLYLKNGKKASISPKAIELFRNELSAQGIPLYTEVPSKSKYKKEKRTWKNFAAWCVLIGFIFADILYLVLHEKFMQNSIFLFFGINILFAIILLVILLNKKNRSGKQKDGLK